MFVNNQNWGDFKKYYEKCWIKVKECGERIYLVYNVSQHSAELHGISRGENDDDANVQIDLDIGYHIDYVIPKKTVFQFGNCAVMLQRVPARMWRKGMDPKNTEMLKCMLGEWHKIPLDMPVIEGFINKPSYYSFDEALAGFAQDIESAALTPRITLSKSGAVFIDSVFVGRYQAEKKLLTYKHVFKENLTPLFNNTTFKTVS